MNKNYIVLLIAYLIFAIPLSVMDSRKFRISLPFLLAGSIVLVLSHVMFPVMPLAFWLKNLLVSLVTSFLVYFSTRILTGDGLGFGDVFFGMYSAVFTGFYMNMVATVFAALLGVLYYLLLALVSRIKKGQIVHRPIFAIPFVPFITAGNLLAFLLFRVIA